MPRSLQAFAHLSVSRLMQKVTPMSEHPPAFLQLLSTLLQARGQQRHHATLAGAFLRAYNHPSRRCHTPAYLDAMAQHMFYADMMLPEEPARPTEATGKSAGLARPPEEPPPLTRLNTDQQLLLLLAFGAARAAYTPTEDAATAYAASSFQQGVAWARLTYACLNLTTIEDSRLATLIMTMASTAPPPHGLGRLLWQFDRAPYANHSLYGGFWPRLFEEHTGIPLRHVQANPWAQQADRERILAYAASRMAWLSNAFSNNQLFVVDEAAMQTLMEWLADAPIPLPPQRPLIKMGGQGREVRGGDALLAGWLTEEWDALFAIRRALDSPSPPSPNVTPFRGHRKGVSAS